MEWYCCSGRVISEMYRGEPKTKTPPRPLHCKLNFFYRCITKISYRILVKCGFGNPHHTLAIYYEHHTELVIQNKEKLTAPKNWRM